jgi:hypothetical protein
MDTVLGHAFSGGGPLNVVILLLGAGVAYAGVRLGARKPAMGVWAKGLTVFGIALVAAGLVIDASSGPAASGASVRIVQPSAGAEVPAGEPIDVVVKVANGALALSPEDTRGGHLHLSVDGVVRQMSSSTQARVTLEPGTHELTVEYVDARHVSFQPAVVTSIEVRAV